MKLLKPTLIALLSLNLTQCAVIEPYAPEFVREKIEENRREKQIEEDNRELNEILQSKRENHPNFPVDKFLETPKNTYKIIDSVFKDTAIKYKNEREKELYSVPEVDPRIPQYLNTVCSHSIDYDPLLGRGNITPNQCINPKYAQAVNARNNAINNINAKYDQIYKTLINLYKENGDFVYKMCLYSWFANDYSTMDKITKTPIHDINEMRAEYNRYRTIRIPDTDVDKEGRHVSYICSIGSSNVAVAYFERWMSQNIYEK